jgi:hypothetical protein
MQLQSDEEFRRFLQRRERLNEQLDNDRIEIDSWIEMHRESDVTVVELGLLEGLLQVRTNHLNELAALDESCMDHLVELLSAQNTSGEH